MSNHVSHHGNHKSGHLSGILQELFSFLDPYADLKYQQELLRKQNKKDSTTKIQQELMHGELLTVTTEEEW